VTEPTVVLDDGSEDLMKFLPVVIIVEDHAAGVAAGGNVVDGAGIFDA